MKISVVINTYNAAKFLKQVLDSAALFDEVVICDMYSTDNTLEIAQEYDCKIVSFPNAGFCEPARNFAIQSASNPYVLVLDADEMVTLELRDFLYAQIQRPDAPAGIRIPRKNYFMGRFMHAGYPDYQCRFLKKEGADWPVEIHSIPTVEGVIELIPASRKKLAFIHLANESIYQRIQKTNQYTEKELIRRAEKRVTVFDLGIKPMFCFFKSYLLKGGFRDGLPGLIAASLDAVYKFVLISKLLEIRSKKA